MERWKRVDPEERPKATIENVPKDKIIEALGIATVYQECPRCGTKQFLNFMPGHNYTEKCKECDYSGTV